MVYQVERKKKQEEKKRRKQVRNNTEIKRKNSVNKKIKQGV